MLTMKSVVRAAVAGAIMLALVVSTSGEAVARPKFLPIFSAMYPKVVEKNGVDGKLKCSVCHPTTSDKKSVRNNYGATVGKGLTKKNESDEAKIKEALTKAAAEKSATEGKTFGDLLTDGSMPGTDEAAK